MVAVWVILCLIFPPIIPFVIVGALIYIATKKPPLTPQQYQSKLESMAKWDRGVIYVSLALFAAVTIVIVVQYYSQT